MITIELNATKSFQHLGIWNSQDSHAFLESLTEEDLEFKNRNIDVNLTC